MYIKIAAVDLYSEDEYRSTAATLNGRFLERPGSAANTFRDVLVLAGMPDSAIFQIFVFIYFIGLACFDQAIDHRTRCGAFRAAAKQPIFPLKFFMTLQSISYF